MLTINVQGQYVGTLTLESSLEKSNRRFVCPSESISFTCSVSGTSLAWEIQEGNTDPYDDKFFRQTDRVGRSFLVSNRLSSCHGEINVFGVLEYIDPRENTSICNSTMTIRPTSLNVSSDCDPLKITCKVLDQEAENNTEDMIYKIASELSNSNCTFEAIFHN